VEKIALQIAARNGHETVVRLQLEYRADVDAKTEGLFGAAFLSFLATTSLLVFRGLLPLPPVHCLPSAAAVYPLPTDCYRTVFL